MLGLIDDTDTSITSNSVNVSLAKLFTPTLADSKSYKIYYNNLCLIHTLVIMSSGGITASTGFGITGQTGLEFFFDDDGVAT